MAEKLTSKKDNIAADKSPIKRKEQKDEVKILKPNPPEESPKDDRTCIKPDPDMGTSFYISEFVMDFLERMRGHKNNTQDLSTLQNSVRPTRPRPLSPANVTEPDSQKLSSPSSEFEVPEHRQSPAPCSPPPAAPPSASPVSVPLLLQTCMLELFSVKQCLQNDEESDTEVAPSESSSLSVTDISYSECISPPLSPEAPPSPPAAISPNGNVSPSKRRYSSSLDFQWEQCDPKKLKSLLDDDDTFSSAISEKTLKPEAIPDSVPPALYPYLLNLSEVYEVSMETVLEAIRLDQQSPFKEKTGLYPSKQGRTTQKDVEEKNGLHQSKQEKVTASKSDSILIKDSGRQRKGGPYKNKPKS